MFKNPYHSQDGNNEHSVNHFKMAASEEK